MSGWLESLATGPDGWAWTLGDSALRGGIVLALAAAAALALRKSSAAVRHLVWTVGCLGALAVPILTALVPAWPVSVPAAATWPAPPRSTGPRSVAIDYGAQRLALERLVRERVLAPKRASISGPARLETTDRPAAREPAQPAATTKGGPSAGVVILSLWLAGTVATLLPAGAGLVSLWRLGRGTSQSCHSHISTLLDRLAAEMHIRRRVRLVLSVDRAMPMTWGAWRPVVLLPGESETWPEGRLTMVLLHELAHVKRGDFVTQLLARVACALHWFNPLAWAALGRVRVEQERACDDLVLGRGLEPSEYAGHLLEVLSGSSRRRVALAAAAGMASASPVEGRLRSILENGTDRRPAGTRAVLCAALLGTLVALPVAAARSRADEPAKSKASSVVADDDLPADQDAVLERLKSMYVKPPDTAALVNGAIKGMVEALHDPHSSYLAPDEIAELERQTSQAMTGVGLQLKAEAGKVVVIAAIPDSPASQAGLLGGDVVTAVDGQKIAGQPLAEIVKKVRGKAGTPVTLTVERDGKSKDIALTRSPIRLRSVESAGLGEAGKAKWLIDDAKGIGYIHINQFGASSVDELKAAIEAAKGEGMKGLVLDLRGCPGGLLNAAVGVASLFLDDGPIVAIHKRDGKEEMLKAEAGKSLGDFPLAVLIDGTTSSAAEVLSGALQDRGRAVLIGSRTRGKGSIQSIVKLKDGGAIKITTSFYTLPSGRNIDHSEGQTTWGVDPNEGDYLAPTGKIAEGVPFKVDPADPQVVAGIKAVTSKLATGKFAQVGEPLPKSAGVPDPARLAEVRQKRQSLLMDLRKTEEELERLGAKARD